MGEKDSFHSGTIFEIRKSNSNKKGNNEARTINKRLPPPNTIENLLTKADWASAALICQLSTRVPYARRGCLYIFHNVPSIILQLILFIVRQLVG